MYFIIDYYLFNVACNSYMQIRFQYYLKDGLKDLLKYFLRAFRFPHMVA